MSDPVTNVEIEDVLSSIRRLVSTGDREEPTSKDIPETPEKLVLTPSLRVTGQEPEDSAEPDAPAATEPVFEHYVPDEPADKSDTQDTSEPEAEATSEDVWAEEAETPEEEVSDTPDAAPVIADPEPVAEESSDATEEPAADDPDTASDDTNDHPGASDLLARVAGFEKAVAAQEDDWDPEGDDDNAAQPTEALPWQDAEDEDDAAETSPVTDEPVEATQADEAEIEDAEEISETEGLDPFEPDEDDFAPDMIAAAAAPKPEEDAANAFLAEDDPLGDEAAILDEEALRDLVTEIVRQELQGSLGERITRNVRKLVRREIHRALAAQELE